MYKLSESVQYFLMNGLAVKAFALIEDCRVSTPNPRLLTSVFSALLPVQLSDFLFSVLLFFLEKSLPNQTDKACPF
ncbi:hypothetical protein [Chryseobacterium sp. CCH4-E10]|uniref:hypothetical protein n=1 Tax=Chryseobacterium sp. CCH4-E10 TaxID=1768758 RepID=UPI00082D995A|nr:hypothetical protein [Chryseobacterium sp. CCH4-E10]